MSKDVYEQSFSLYKSSKLTGKMVIISVLTPEVLSEKHAHDECQNSSNVKIMSYNVKLV